MSESAESYIGTNWREFVQELYASLFKHSRAGIVETLSCWGNFLSKCWVRRPYWIQWNPLTRMSKAQSRNISLVIVQPTREDLWVGSLHIHKTISALIFADKHGCHWLFTLKPRESLAVVSDWRPSQVFIEIQRQGKILPPICLCSGKMWKTNVKSIFSYDFPCWPVGVKSYHVVLKLLRNHLRPVNKPVPN